MERKAKKVCESEAEQVQLVMANHLNGSGRLFGGQLAEWIDVLAGVVARRHCNSNITTASIDSLNFKEAVHLNGLMVLHGKVTYVGNTSMEIRVDSYVENRDGVRRLVNTAYLTEVALDDEDRPTTVPGLICDSEEEKQEYQAGIRRREIRLQLQNIAKGKD